MTYEEMIVRGSTVGELHEQIEALEESGWETVNSFYYCWDGREAGFEWKVRRPIEDEGLSGNFETPKPSAADTSGGFLSLSDIVWLFLAGIVVGIAGNLLDIPWYAVAVVSGIVWFGMTWVKYSE